MNVLSHVGAASMVRGYSPGLVTAVLVNLPFSAYLIGRAAREPWLSRRRLLGASPISLLIHGPLLVGLLSLSGLLVRL